MPALTLVEVLQHALKAAIARRASIEAAFPTCVPPGSPESPLAAPLDFKSRDEAEEWFSQNPHTKDFAGPSFMSSEDWSIANAAVRRISKELEIEIGQASLVPPPRVPEDFRVTPEVIEQLRHEAREVLKPYPPRKENT